MFSWLYREKMIFLYFRGVRHANQGQTKYNIKRHSLFHVCGSFFLRSLKMGSQMEVSLAMDRLMYCSWPKKPLISFSLLGGGISNKTLILDGSTSIPLSFTRNPNNFSAVTPKMHFCGFNLNLYSLILSKNFLKFMVWLPLSYHQRTPLSHYSSYHVARS